MRGPTLVSGVLQIDIDDENIRRFYAYGSGSAGDIVVIDMTAGSITAHGYQAVEVLPHTEAGNEEALVVGVALDAWSADETIIRVQVGGVAENVNVDAGVAIGDLLIPAYNTTDAGRVKAAHDTVAGSYNQGNLQLMFNSRAVGVALTAASSNKATVRLLNPLNF